MRKHAAAIFALASLLSAGLVCEAIPAFAESGPNAAGLARSLSALDPTGKSEYVLDRVLPVPYGTIYRYEQYLGDCRADGGEIIVAADKEGKILSQTGAPVRAEGLRAGRLGREEAVAVSLADKNVVSAAREIRVYGGIPEYVWNVVADGVRYYLSASDGRIEETAPVASAYEITEQTDAYGNTVEVGLEKEGQYRYLEDRTRNIFTYDMRSSMSVVLANRVRTGVLSTKINDPIAVSAYYNTVKAYDFYADGKGIGVVWCGMDNGNDEISGNYTENGEMLINLLVHYGSEYQNAAFGEIEGDGYFAIGDGKADGDLYEPAKALDLIAHEYQHGVTRFTANLESANEAGALNEAFSDIFGMLIEDRDMTDDDFWNMGENAVPAGKTAVRSVKNITDGYRYNAMEKYPDCTLPHTHDGDCDAGGVHLNCPIISHVQYKLWSKMPEYFTKERIGELWFSTLCALPSAATFDDFAREFQAAAARLGFTDEAASAIREALVSSGLLPSENPHIVTFRDSDGRVLDRVVVAHGEKAYEPVVPDRPIDRRYVDRFAGWSEDVSNVTEDMTVDATYVRAERVFTVQFLGMNGELLKSEEVTYGGDAVPPEAADFSEGDYDFEFERWSEPYTDVTRDLTVTAIYKSYLCHTVTFECDGTALATLRVRDGDTAVPPEDPARESSAEFDYVFSGWDGELGPITEDVVLRATFEQKRRSYSVVYLSDGERYDELTLAYGAEVPLPAIPEGYREGYRFTGWFTDEGLTVPAEGGISVTGGLTLYAGWEKLPEKELDPPAASGGCGIVGFGGGGAIFGTLVVCTAAVLARKKRRV